MTDTAPKHYHLRWPPFWRGSAYLLLMEIIALWIAGNVDLLPTFIVRHWWLWPLLTLTVGTAVRAGTRLRLDERGTALTVFGMPLPSSSWRNVEKARLLKVGGTVVLLGKKDSGRFELRRWGNVRAADDLAREMAGRLAGRLEPNLTPPYRRPHKHWTIRDSLLEIRSPRYSRRMSPEDLLGIKSVFLEGEDLPARVYLFPADGGPALHVGWGVSYFPFLAADLLKLARLHGVKHKSVDLQSRPRPSQASRQPLPRAWESEFVILYFLLAFLALKLRRSPSPSRSTTT